MQYLNLTQECVQLIESLSPLGLVDKTDMGRYYEVPVGDQWYRVLANQRRPDENWSDVIMRLVRENQRLTDFRSKT